MNNYKILLVLMFTLISNVMLVCTNGEEKIKIINDTQHVLNIDLSLPEQTVTDIKIKKLNILQDALHEGIMGDSVEKIKAALFAGADINKVRDGKFPLLLAILLKRHNAIETLLVWGAKTDKLCVQNMSKNNDLKSLLLLVKQDRTHIDLGSVTNAFYNAVRTRSVDALFAYDFIKELVYCGYPISDLWEMAILLANFDQSNGEEAIRLLLIRGGNINCTFKRNNSGPVWTPLLYAAGNWPNKNVVKLLLEAGANVNQQVRQYHDKKSYTPLAYAIERNRSNEIIELLLEYGANL